MKSIDHWQILIDDVRCTSYMSVAGVIIVVVVVFLNWIFFSAYGYNRMVLPIST